MCTLFANGMCPILKVPLAHSLYPRSFSPSISTQKTRLSLQLLSVKVPRQADERGGGSKEDVASVN